MIPLLFLDTETTGLRPDFHTPWEIAWEVAIAEPSGTYLRLKGGRSFFVDLDSFEREAADPFALEVGKFAERYDDLESLDRREILRRLQADIAAALDETQEKAIHLVGAVPSFDHAMISQNWTGWPGFGEGIWHYHLVDVEAVMAGRLGIQPPWNSHELSERLGVAHDRSKMHTAMGDVQWAIDCYAAAYDLKVLGRTW